MGFFDFFKTRETKAIAMMGEMAGKLVETAINGAILDRSRVPADARSGRLIGYIFGLQGVLYSFLTDAQPTERAQNEGVKNIQKLFPQFSQEVMNLLYARPALPSILRGFALAKEDGERFAAQLPTIGIHTILLEDYLHLLKAPDIPEGYLKMANAEAALSRPPGAR